MKIYMNTEMSEMPTSCIACDLYATTDSGCVLWIQGNNAQYESKRHPNCPLVSSQDIFKGSDCKACGDCAVGVGVTCEGI